MKRLMTAAMAISFGLAGAAQAQDVETLFEAGQYTQAIETAGDTSSPADLYVVAHSHDRLDHGAEARAAYERLRGHGGAWGEVAQSAIHLLDGNTAEALAAAERAVAADGNLAEAHYQLGLAQGHANNFAAAAPAFEQAGMLDPNFAYAFYHAGLSYYRVKRIDLMAKHFEAFLRLAPNAPERPEVESTMRTVRGR